MWSNGSWNVIDLRIWDKSTLNSSPSALTGENPRIKASAAPRLLIPSDLSPVKAEGEEFNVYITKSLGKN